MDDVALGDDPGPDLGAGRVGLGVVIGLVGEIAADDREGFVHVIGDDGAVERQQLGDDMFEGGVGFHFLTTEYTESTEFLMERGLARVWRIFADLKPKKVFKNPRESASYSFST